MRHENNHHHESHGRGTPDRRDRSAGRAEPDIRGEHGESRGRGDGRGRSGARRSGGRGRGDGRRGGQRGDVRAAILALLAERPMHGYEMLSEIESRTRGLWRPSPGSLYPALQLLEDQELVRSVSDGGRRSYELTEAGRAGQAAASAGPAPWDVIVRAADQDEVALSDILRQVAVAVDQVAEVGSTAQKTSAEALLAGLRRQLYLLLAETPAGAGAAADDAAPPAQETWNRVEGYFDGALLGWDSDLERALRASGLAGLPGISVSPSQGKLLHLLAKSTGACRILEIGTLGGYSTIWLARALPADGRLITLELDAHHAEVARANVASSGLAERVDIRVGPALDSLEAMGSGGEPPFDVVFIDADKESNAEYFAWAMRLTHPGSLVIVDNVVRHGHVADAASTNPGILGVRRLVDAMVADGRIDATAIQTVGSKGYDGLAIGLVTDPGADQDRA